MSKERREQEAMNSMNISMPPMPLNDYRYCPYYVPNLQSINNYQKIAYMNNIQPMNGYLNPMEYYEEESHMNPQNKPENASTPSKNSINSKNAESPKDKTYIHFLFNTISNLFKEGKITMKYLEEKTENKEKGINKNRTVSDYSSSSSKDTLGSCIKPNDVSKKNICQNSGETNNAHYPNRKTGNNQSCKPQCENPLCNYVFNSSKEQNTIKIKGLKTQEKKLCKKCCEAVEKGNYCYYCNAIYRDYMSDAAKWVKCDFCQNWEHFECELLKGKRFNSTQELNDVKQYMCPVCTNKKAKQNNIDNKIQKKLINKKRKGDIFEDQKCRKNQRKDLRKLKSEKSSELFDDMQLIESFKKCK